MPRKREAGASFTLEHIEKQLCGFRTGKVLFCRGLGKNTDGSKYIHALLRYLRFLVGKNANGIIDALTSACPNVKIVEQQSASLTDEGVELGENFLQAHPNMQVICGINDNAVLGAYQVWSAAGHVGDNIGFFGADADEGALDLISQGTSYRGSVALTAEESFPELIDACVAASKGETVPETMYLGMTQITAENVADFMK